MITVVAIAAVVVDVVLLALLLSSSRRVRASRRLVAERDEHLRFLASTSHDWIWESDAQLVLRTSNTSVRGLLGHDPESLIGRSLVELLAEADAAQIRRIAATLHTDPDSWRDISLRWRGAAGNEIPLIGSATPILGRDGQVTGFRGITQRRIGEVGQNVLDGALRTRQILAERSLTVALQPIIDLATRRWVGVEALARFGGGATPDQVFADAHAAGLGVELELFALQTALDVTGQLPPDVHLSVNASPMLILDRRFASELAAREELLGRIVLEITEHAVVDRYDEIHTILQPLRARGLRLAVDDTGGGYASFSHVLRLRPDVIKLDRSLIAHVATDAAVRALVTAVVLLALEMDASVTAEGVETAAAMQTVGALGVDTAQGYLIGHPTTERSVWAAWPDAIWSFEGELDLTRLERG